MKYGDPSLKTFYLLEILMERTDEAHPLSASDLIRILESDYEIHMNRTTVYSEIRKLLDADVDIIRRESRPAGYYVGSRQFELAELKLLVDAVQFSNFVTKKKTVQLIRKLETLCSRDEAKQLSSQVTVYNRSKAPNETIFYNVDHIHSAIFQNHQITYQYVEWTMEKELVPRHDGAYYNVSPLHLIWDDENYYLIAYDEQTAMVRHYRVDKMRDLVIQEDLRSGKALEQKIDVAAFSRKTFGMYSGVDREVELRGPKHLCGVILDRFGTDIFMRPVGVDEFSAAMTVTVSRQFFGWLTAIGEELRITGPEEVKEQYRQYLEGILRGMSSEEPKRSCEE